MGQCSTLPAEGRNNEQPAGGRFQQRGFGMTDDGSSHVQQQHQQQQQQHQPMPRGRGQYRRGDSNSVLQVTVPRNEEKESRRRNVPPTAPSQVSYQTRQSSQSSMMQEDTLREAPPTVDNAKRARCYQLNLESDFVGMSGDVRVEGSLLGPYEHPPPPLTYSASDDSDSNVDPTAVAIRTAQIFRGITIAKDGTILSQNARATRSNRGNNKTKRGEKSRQAAKIEKAKDLVEESILTGKAPGSDEPANLVSLYIMGEYDEMKYLVRDGSKKLREASSLPDDALLAINRSRTNSFLGGGSGLVSPMSRKRVSPNTHHSEPMMTSQGSTVPPKLKGHPRDLPSSRRDDNRRRGGGGSSGGGGGGGFLPVHESCGFAPQYGDTNDDWIGISNGLNSIWNCGQTNESGTASPVVQVVTNPAKDYGGHHHGRSAAQSQHQQPPPQQRVYEGRNESSYNGRHDPSNISMRA